MKRFNKYLLHDSWWFKQVYRKLSVTLELTNNIKPLNQNESNITYSHPHVYQFSVISTTTNYTV